MFAELVTLVLTSRSRFPMRSSKGLDMVELSAGCDSRGGLSGVRDAEVSIGYGMLHAMLVERGFNVVPCLKDYF